MLRRVVLLLLSSLVFGPVLAAAQQGTADLRGRVVDSQGGVLPGVAIGDGAVIGAGSVVTRDVAAGVTVAGNPARRLRSGS